MESLEKLKVIKGGSDWSLFHYLLSPPPVKQKLKILQLVIVYRIVESAYRIEGSVDFCG
jgi:hypothetical protein